MEDFEISVNLSKLKGAFVQTFNGATTTKRCIVIPIEDSGLYEGKSGITLYARARQRKEVGRFGDTHFIKPNVSKSAYKAMSEEERRNIPIIGDVRPVGAVSNAQPSPVSQEVSRSAGFDDMPF